MPRQASSRELALRERWPKWEAEVEGFPGEYAGGARLPTPGLHPVNWPHVYGRFCTRRSDAWRSLARAMERTRKALEEKP